VNTGSCVRVLELTSISESPTNPRQRFEAIDELAADIERRGLLLPLVVRELRPNRFEVVCGARRLRALRLNGAAYAQVIIGDLNEVEGLEVQLAEIALTRTVSPYEEAVALQRLRDDFGYSIRKVAEKIGKSTGYVVERTKLLTMSPEALQTLSAAGVPPSVAVEIARHVPHGDAQVRMARDVSERRVSTRQVRTIMRTSRPEAPSPLVRGRQQMRDRVVLMLRARAAVPQDLNPASALLAAAAEVEAWDPMSEEKARERSPSRETA
jgi:ParB family chromosome partitioning protein